MCFTPLQRYLRSLASPLIQYVHVIASANPSLSYYSTAHLPRCHLISSRICQMTCATSSSHYPATRQVLGEGDRSSTTAWSITSSRLIIQASCPNISRRCFFIAARFHNPRGLFLNPKSDLSVSTFFFSRPRNPGGRVTKNKGENITGS
jgi:hypothetical protein